MLIWILAMIGCSALSSYITYKLIDVAIIDPQQKQLVEKTEELDKNSVDLRILKAIEEGEIGVKELQELGLEKIKDKTGNLTKLVKLKEQEQQEALMLVPKIVDFLLPTKKKVKPKFVKSEVKRRTIHVELMLPGDVGYVLHSDIFCDAKDGNLYIPIRGSNIVYNDKWHLHYTHCWKPRAKIRILPNSEIECFLHPESTIRTSTVRTQCPEELRKDLFRKIDYAKTTRFYV